MSIQLCGYLDVELFPRLKVIFAMIHFGLVAKGGIHKEIVLVSHSLIPGRLFYSRDLLVVPYFLGIVADEVWSGGDTLLG